MSTTLERQNRVIIELLARSTIGVKEIENIVRKGKQKGNSDNFVKAYNQLDGTKSVTDIAKIVNVTKQNMSQVIQTWEEKGIVYNVGTDTKPAYVGLLKLPISRSNSKVKKGKAERLIENDIPSLKSDLPGSQVSNLQDDSPVEQILMESSITDETEG